MSASPVSRQSQTTFNWSSLIQAVFSSLAAVLLVGGALIIALAAVFEYFNHSSVIADLTQSFLVAGSLAFAGLLLVPSAWYSWKSVSRPNIDPVYRPERRYFGLILTAVVLVLTTGALFLGNWASQDSRIGWLLLPPLNILATGLPALWMIYIGTHGLLPHSPKRSWGVFASGLVLGPFTILILELLLLVVVGILSVLWIMTDPSLSGQLSGLAARLQNAAPDLNNIFEVLLPFLVNPGVLFLGLAFISVLVPLVEESLKPIGVWFLAGQKITPAQGYGYGVISGAGFGLFENLGNTSGGGDMWSIVAASRISTILLHCFTAGLVGWALASAWSQRRYLRLGVTFAIAVLIHGLWNGMAVLSTASTLNGVANITIPASLQQLGSLATVGVLVLGLLVLILYIGFNAALRRGIPRVTAPPVGGQADSPTAEGTPTAPLPEINTPASPSNHSQFTADSDHPLETQDYLPHLDTGENSRENTGKNK